MFFNPSHPSDLDSVHITTDLDEKHRIAHGSICLRALYQIEQNGINKQTSIRFLKDLFVYKHPIPLFNTEAIRNIEPNEYFKILNVLKQCDIKFNKKTSKII